MVGAPGTVCGVTVTEPDAGPVPAELVAVTEHVYAVPLVSPVTVMGEPAALALIAPGLQVAV
jgi:hypothetical protein